MMNLNQVMESLKNCCRVRTRFDKQPDFLVLFSIENQWASIFEAHNIVGLTHILMVFINPSMNLKKILGHKCGE